MAGLSEQSIDPKRTVVVLNFPSNVGEDELTIHFQKERNGGGDVDDVLLDGSVAFVTFDMHEVATSVLNHPEQIINGSRIEVQSYELWLRNKKVNEGQGSPAVDKQEDSRPEDAANKVTTTFVNSINISTPKNPMTLSFESKRRSGGGDLRKGKEGFKRLGSPTFSRLAFVSSKDALGVRQKANEKPLQRDYNLNVSSVFEPTHDRSILLAKNLNPQTKKETFVSFVEFVKNASVLNVVFGKGGKAIVILNSEIEKDGPSKESSKEDMKLDGSIISLEFAPLTKGIRIGNIPPGTSSDDIKYKFSSRKICGGQVTEVKLDKKSGVANVYFEKSSVVSELVKKEHKFEGVLVTVTPYYDDFEELQEITTKTTEFSGGYNIEPLVMDYLLNKQKIETKFDFKSMKYNKEKSRFHFTKDFEDPNLAQEFENKLKEFLHSFVKEEVKIPKAVFEKVKESLEGKKAEFKAEKVDFRLDGYRVTLIGKKEDVALKKQSIEAMIDRISEEAKFKSTELVIHDKNKLKFLNFIDYFKNVMSEFRGVEIHGMESSSGKLSLLGTAEKTKNVKIKISEDLKEISEIDVKMSDRQIDFLQRTKCQIVNDELKNYCIMLMLISVNGLQAKIFSLTKCGYNEVELLLNIVQTKTREKCVKFDKETASLLKKSGKLQELKKKQFEKNRVMIYPDLAEPCNIWIVCEKSKIDKVEEELSGLADEKKIISRKLKFADPMRLRFLKQHCWDKIKEKEHRCKAEGVVVVDSGNDSLEVKGTKAGREELISFLTNLCTNVVFKAYLLTEPGMKKQMSMEATNAIISEIEKKHECLIKREFRPSVEVHRESSELAAAVADEWIAVRNKEVKMASGQRITIVVGDLAQQKVDVIVNTTNERVDFSNPCGKALLKVAGNELLNECKRIGSLQKGEMASTGPAKLNCKRVYHVRSSSWNNGNGALILRQLIKKCLDQVEKDRLTSIAIPAIGTGTLGFPRREVAKIFLEEVSGYLTARPQSTVNDIRFVTYSGDRATVDAFLDAVQKFKSVISSPPSRSVPRLFARREVITNAGSLNNVTPIDKLDGSLELSLGSKNLTVQIVCSDISKERTDLIMHVVNETFSFDGGVAKALIRAGGDSIVQECKALGRPALFSTRYTNAGRLNVRQIAHVVAPGSMKVADLRICLERFFDDVMKKNIFSISFSAIGAGALGRSENESANLIFDTLSRIAESKNLASLSLVRIVIVDKAKFINFKDATKTYFASRGASSLSTQQGEAYFHSSGATSLAGVEEFNRGHLDEMVWARPAQTTARDGGTSIKIYSDNRSRIDKVWQELKRKISENILEKTMNDDVITKFSFRDHEKLRKLEREYDVRIEVDCNRGMVRIKGHSVDVADVQEKIAGILKDIKDNERKFEGHRTTTSYWDSSLIVGRFNKFNLSASSKEYRDVEAAFHRTSSNQIVRIERIENREIYEHYNLKRQAMVNKYGSNLAGKELMLFHGTSRENIEKINAGGFDRSFAGKNGKAYGRGVYFARDAIYSCNTTFSPPDSQGLRYMYYAKVLVGEYTQGNPNMLVAPNKRSTDPNETFDSVVDNIANPKIFVIFKDYVCYTEYLIAFR